MRDGAHKQWGHRGNWVQGVWSTRGMGQMGNGVHVQCGYWVTGGIRHMDNGADG